MITLEMYTLGVATGWPPLVVRCMCPRAMLGKQVSVGRRIFSVAIQQMAIVVIFKYIPAMPKRDVVGTSL